MKLIQSMAKSKMNKLYFVIFCTLLMNTSSCSDNISVPDSGDRQHIIYISPDGDDNGEGKRNSPLATLDEVHKRIREKKPDMDVLIRIYSDRGDYVNQTVVWEYYNTDNSIIFESYPEDKFANFTASENAPPELPFFKLIADNGEPTNLVFRRLIISDYVTRAIMFIGYRETEKYGWNGYNIIENCVISGIGNNRMPERQFVHGAITLVNSRNNIIRNCVIEGCANSNVDRTGEKGQYDIPEKEFLGSSDCSSKILPITCIYIAHYSHSNIIENNLFENNEGDCIRLRDRCCGNTISANLFLQSGWKAAVTSWYCIYNFKNCTKTTPECSSWGNLLCDNIMYGTWHCLPSLFMDLSYDEYTGIYCEIPQEYDFKFKLINNSSFGCR